MHPYAHEVMARLHAEELGREAVRYRLGRRARRRAGRRERHTLPTSRSYRRGRIERPCVDC
jgi:hypothetical protein